MAKPSSGNGFGPLNGRVAVVTGAAQGLGAAFAQALARNGASVVAGDVASTAATCAAIEASGGNALGVGLDVTDPASIGEMLKHTGEKFGVVDILVNNAAIAGQFKLQPLTEISTAEWDRALTVNVCATFECIKAVAPVMKQRGYGKIINLSSGTAIKGSPGLAHYVASKGAIISLTRAAARSWRRWHPRECNSAWPHHERINVKESKLDRRDCNQQHCRPSLEARSPTRRPDWCFDFPRFASK